MKEKIRILKDKRRSLQIRSNQSSKKGPRKSGKEEKIDNA